MSQSFEKLVFDSFNEISQEGHGRQNRKLAVAHHKRHNGRSEFIVAQSAKGILSPGDDSFVGTVTSNLMGSKYNIWDQVSILDNLEQCCLSRCNHPHKHSIPGC